MTVAEEIDERDAASAGPAEGPQGGPGAVADLSARLWRERELLDLLTFKLEEQHLVLTAGRTRWVSHATREVEQVVERLRAAGLERAAVAAVVASDWGLADDAGLRDLAAGATDAVWAEILTEHLTAMTEQTAAIRELRDANGQFLRSAARSTQETLAATDTTSTTYDAHGRPASPEGTPLFDRDL